MDNTIDLYLDENYFNTSFLFAGEVWKPLLGYGGRYLVSTFGRVRSLNLGGGGRDKILTAHLRAGYRRTSLCIDGDKQTFCVHRLVAQVFILNPENKEYINHKNCIKHDNRVENLEWVTAKENTRHAWGNGLGVRSGLGKHGKNHHHSKVVYQYNLNGGFIKEWESVTDAAKGVGSNKAQISANCRGKGFTTKGFKWSFSKIEN